MKELNYKRISDEALIARINEYLTKFPNVSRSKLFENIGSSYDRITGLEKEGKVTLPQKRGVNYAWSRQFNILGKEQGRIYGRRNRQSQ